MQKKQTDLELGSEPIQSQMYASITLLYS